ncbi:MAG: hypothetical protein P8N50_13630, partial [Actinomycetota bacterium]|nr:hypothetical protein [Actinomycetota bacterium]
PQQSRFSRELFLGGAMSVVVDVEAVVVSVPAEGNAFTSPRSHLRVRQRQRVSVQHHPTAITADVFEDTRHQGLVERIPSGLEAGQWPCSSAVLGRGVGAVAG